MSFRKPLLSSSLPRRRQRHLRQRTGWASELWRSSVSRLSS
jgi:hypothetical protein